MRAFNLEEAKAGKPLVTRDGRDAKFIAHVPECTMTNRIIALISGKSVVFEYSEKGIYVGGDGKSGKDLFMKTKKEFANLFLENIYGKWISYDSEEEAKKWAKLSNFEYVAIAVPIEIEE